MDSTQTLSADNICVSAFHLEINFLLTSLTIPVPSKWFLSKLNNHIGSLLWRIILHSLQLESVGFWRIQQFKQTGPIKGNTAPALTLPFQLHWYLATAFKGPPIIWIIDIFQLYQNHNYFAPWKMCKSCCKRTAILVLWHPLHNGWHYFWQCANITTSLQTLASNINFL